MFRQGRSRETSYARDYDRFFELLNYEREHGNILWVMGPALPLTPTPEGLWRLWWKTATWMVLWQGMPWLPTTWKERCSTSPLGQDIYTQKSHPNGHYNHLDVINRVRRSGSIPQFIEDYKIDDGIMYSCVKNKIPFVLTDLSGRRPPAGSHWKRL